MDFSELIVFSFFLRNAPAGGPELNNSNLTQIQLKSSSNLNLVNAFRDFLQTFGICQHFLNSPTLEKKEKNHTLVRVRTLSAVRSSAMQSWSSHQKKKGKRKNLKFRQNSIPKFCILLVQQLSILVQYLFSVPTSDTKFGQVQIATKIENIGDFKHFLDKLL